MRGTGAVGLAAAMVALAVAGCTVSPEASSPQPSATTAVVSDYGQPSAATMDRLGCTERAALEPTMAGVAVRSVDRCRYQSWVIELVTFDDAEQESAVQAATEQLIADGGVPPGEYFFASGAGWRIQGVEGYGRDAPDAAAAVLGGSVDSFVVPEPEPPAESPQAAAPQDVTTSGTVTNVVDGDTIDVGSDRIRVIGIDTPERGECNYETASNAMARLVLGKDVTLTAVSSKDDVDKYGRLLRYVDVGGTDAGLSLIKAGLAIARYDSRDGYGAHPREDAYIAADAAAPNKTCATAKPKRVVPAPVVPKKKTGNCDPSYPGVCIPPAPPDLDCGDITERRFVVKAPDPHRFDADKDGIGCESG